MFQAERALDSEVLGGAVPHTSGMVACDCRAVTSPELEGVWLFPGTYVLLLKVFVLPGIMVVTESRRK